jgi:aminomethyltransferase
MGADTSSTSLQRTPLYELHVSLGAKMVPFAGYEMPVQYPLGILKEHLHTRSGAGLFDVSHMGQAFLVASDKRFETVAGGLELLAPADFLGLRPGQQRYSQLLNDEGGIIDDLMVTRLANESEDGVAMLVVNASRKDIDFAHIQRRLVAYGGLMLIPNQSRGLLAIQGPMAADVLEAHSPGVTKLQFMHAANVSIAGIDCHVSRSGYTGEDGFEISVPSDRISDLWVKLSSDDRVQPIGLGARDSLRLEAGLCLYGHDIDETTSPIEAGLLWSIQKRRRTEGGFPGAARIQDEIANGPRRRRVGIKPEGRAPAREGTEVVALLGDPIGVITSGGFGPSVNAPVAMGYVGASYAEPGTPVNLMVRGKALPALIATMPFAPHRYVRKI